MGEFVPLIVVLPVSQIDCGADSAAFSRSNSIFLEEMSIERNTPRSVSIPRGRSLTDYFG